MGFLFTLVPFVHGALVYLYSRHTVPSHDTRSRILVIWDFFLLFVEAILLLVAARVVDQPRNLIFVLASLWVVDIVWIEVGEKLVPRADGVRTHLRRRWVRINFCAALSGFLIWLLIADESSLSVALLVAGLTVSRTIVDYWWGWLNYFPEGGNITATTGA